MAGLTVLRVVDNATMVRREQDEATRAELESRQNAPLILGIVAYLKSCWDAAKMAKLPIEHSMLKAMRQRNGEYEAEKLNQINKTGGSNIFMMLTEVKCRAAESWLRDILMDTGSPPWDIAPTPIPELSPEQSNDLQDTFATRFMEVLQQNARAPTKDEADQLHEMVAQEFRFRLLQMAQARADRMKHKIEDQFVQGGFSDAFNEFITDLVTFPAAFIKGPVVRRQRVLGWSTDETGRTVADAKERLAPEYERVDPYRIYPEPGVTNINDGYLFQHHPMTRMSLSNLIGVPGYDEQAIREILQHGSMGSWVNTYVDAAKQEQERKHSVERSPTSMFDVLEFWGKISGKMLREWGMTEVEIEDEAREYDANIWLCGNYVIKAVLNYDPLGEKPYTKSSFIKIPGAFWGRGIPEIIEDVQNICNAAARAMVNNMGIASGPQVEVNIERLPPNEDVTQIHPWKIWQVLNDPAGVNAPAVRFTQPSDNSGTLMAVYDRFSRMADDHSGIPAYVHGDLDTQGAGRTASGLSMLMGSAGKGIRQIVMHIDSDVIKLLVKRQYIYNMRYDEDESIKGDVEIVPKGAVNLAVKETVNVRRIEFLNATANQLDAEIIGKDGRAAILREVAKGLQMPVDEIIPSREKAAANAQAQAAAPPAGAAPNAAMASAPAMKTLQAGGAEKGGMEGNTVSLRQ